MSKKSTSGNSGISFTGLLTIAFIVLKLIGKIDWSWWWVLSPLWIGIAIMLLILLGLFSGAVIADGINNRKAKKIREFTNRTGKSASFYHEDKSKEKSRWQQRIDELNKVKTKQ